NLLGNTQSNQPPRIVELVVRHWSHDLGHAGRKSLCAAANAAVMDKRRRARQKLAHRHEAHVADRFRQLFRQLMIVLGEQDATSPKPPASIDRSSKELMRLLIRRAR